MKTKRLLFLGFLAVPMLCIALHASAVPNIPITNIVNNGGFETGDFTGWTQGGNTAFTGVDSTNPHSGNFGAFMGPLGSPGTLTQNLTTIASSNYELSFFLGGSAGGSESANGGGGVFFQVFWNGVMIFDTSSQPSGYTQFQFFNLTATGPTTELKFVFQNDPAFWELDDIVAGITAPTSVPEAFSTLWLALPVFGMFGLAQLRRKKA
jgi:hypothetical protein